MAETPKFELELTPRASTIKRKDLTSAGKPGTERLGMTNTGEPKPRGLGLIFLWNNKFEIT